ncbi:MAG: 3'(2'),5'-bisphosphate nucleotidase [Phycisphaeraceae bacterium]
MSNDRTDQLEIAVAAVRRAAAVTQSVQRNLVTAETLTKKDRSPVTVADFASQAVVCRALAAAFPDTPVVGEEGTAALRQEGQAELRHAVVREAGEVLHGASEAHVLEWIDHGGAQGEANGTHWTLDPIDGTKGFLRGEQYAIALALIEAGEVVLGVLGCPNLPMPGDGEPGVLMTAIRGEGTQMLPLSGQGLEGAQPVRTAALTDPAAARFCESVESGHTDQSQSVRIAERLGITAEPFRIDSQAKYAAVARGDAAVYLRLPTRADYREKIWDHAAGAIVVEEAGGKVTDIEGKPLDFSRGRKLENNRGVIATNGPIHDAVLEAVGAVASVGD